MKTKNAITLLILSCLMTVTSAYADHALDSLLLKKKYQIVLTESQKKIKHFLSSNQPDSILPYIFYAGESMNKLNGIIATEKLFKQIINDSKNALKYHYRVYGIYIEAADYLSNQNNYQSAYQLLNEAEAYYINHKKIQEQNKNVKEFNQGNFAMYMGNYELAKRHFSSSAQAIKSLKDLPYEKLYFTYNGLGIVNWYSGLLDSSIYYFNLAVDALKQSEPTPTNKYFRVALVKNNIAECYNSLGKNYEATKTLKECINNFKQFINDATTDPKKDRAITNMHQVTDNLAKIYFQIGDFAKAKDLLNYSYNQKSKQFGKDNIEVGKSLIMLATLSLKERNYKKAQQYTNQAYQIFSQSKDTSTSWFGETLTLKAKLSQHQNQQDSTTFKLYERAYKINEAAYGNNFDENYLSFLSQYAQYHARKGLQQEATKAANKALDYVIKTQGKQSLNAIRQITNQSIVSFYLKQYNDVTKSTTQAISLIDTAILNQKNIIDSITLLQEKPALILYHAKAQYQLLPYKDSITLKNILQKLQNAKSIIDARNALHLSDKNKNFNVDHLNELDNFIKKINLELYQLTGKTSYFKDLLQTHENAIYGKIRSRFNHQQAIQFAHLPQSIQQEEQQLLSAINTALVDSSPKNNLIKNYFVAQKKWEQFQQKLKEKYSAYYNMRYGNTELNLEHIQKQIPQGVTVVRYIYTESDLIAIITDQNSHELVVLKSDNLDELISNINDPSSTFEQMANASYNLFLQLWQPLQKHITNKRIVIIPDANIYHISFDLLTTQLARSNEDITQHCLLHQYAFSYNYSLLALTQQRNQSQFSKNFIGFAPEFTDHQKNKYSDLVKTDSLSIDYSYLKLLPLPFTTKVLHQLQQTFGGELMINDASTKSNFMSKAGGHQVVYIGTHAEANNIYPEYSRLIFAKDHNQLTEVNSLYLYDIYSCNLASQLSIITACESGLASHQDGEGMISLAHAFNYAGSASILTGLWAIDEQTTAQITTYFFKHLSEGLPKDEALRLAKLDFINQNDGRLLSPKYWAGLAIMGNTDAIDLKGKINWNYIMIIGFSILLISGLILKKKKHRGF